MAIHKYFFALILLAILAVSSLLIGAANVSLADLFNGDEHAYSIYVVSRIPRLLAIVLAGAGLSVAGLIMQQIVQNRFASPSTTGTIDCALLGYVVGLIFLGGASQWTHLGVIFCLRSGGNAALCSLLTTPSI